MTTNSNDRADQKNPNNPRHDKVHGNRGGQKNPNRPQPTPIPNRPPVTPHPDPNRPQPTPIKNPNRPPPGQKPFHKAPAK